MIKGQCNCGTVTFEINAPITDIYTCHCSICRTSSGAHGMVVAIVSNEAFKWLTGEEDISTWRKPVGDWQTWFCRHCGSALPGVNDPLHMYIPAGLIPECGEQMKVAHHMWVDSKASWFEIGDTGKRHPKSFGG